LQQQHDGNDDLADSWTLRKNEECFSRLVGQAFFQVYVNDADVLTASFSAATATPTPALPTRGRDRGFMQDILLQLEVLAKTKIPSSIVVAVET
jgi:hypothetical protein